MTPFNFKRFILTGLCWFAFFNALAQWTTASLSSARYPVGTSSGTIAIFAGGPDWTGNPSAVVDIYDAGTGSWSTASLTIPKGNMTATSLPGLAFFAGGFTTNGVDSDVVDIYNYNTAGWSTASLSVPRGGLASATVGTKAFFAGGFVGAAASNAIDVYESSTDQWSTMELSEARTSLAATSSGTKVFFAGGYDIFNGQQVYSDRVEIYDASTDTWTDGMLSQGRAYLTAASVGTKVLFAGGSYSPSVISDRVEIYDTGTDTWTYTVLSQPRSGMTSVTVGSRVFFAGGYNENGNSNVVDIYDNETDTWATTTLSVARNFLASAAAGSTAIFAGGYATGIGPSNIIDLFDADCQMSSLDVTPSSASICPDESVVLTATGGTTYYWTPEPGLSSLGGSVVTVTPWATTTYTVYATDEDGCTGSMDVTVTVFEDLLAVSPMVAICPGDVTTLTATGANSYTWSPAIGLSATTGSTVDAQPTESTSYTVTGSYGVGCTSQRSVFVGVFTLPIVDVTPHAPVICKGSSVTLIATGASTYTWHPAPGLSATNGPQVTVTPTDDTSYSYEFTDNNNCSVEGSVFVDVLELPAQPDITLSSLNNEVMLTSSELSGNQWYKDGSEIAGATSQALEITESGDYTVQVTEGDCVGPMSSILTIDITDFVTSLSEAIKYLRVFPNPAGESVQVQWSGSDSTTPIDVYISDLTGRTVARRVMSARGGNLDVSNLSSGLYLLHIMQGNLSQMQKLIKK